jgi:hypothetical protein
VHRPSGAKRPLGQVLREARERLSAVGSSLAFALVLCSALTCPAQAQEAKRAVTTQDMNDSINPLNPAVTINFHNFYVPDLGGPFEEDANVFFLRGLFPMMIGETPNLVRFSLPVITEPTIHGGHASGWGDLVVFDVAVFEQDGWAFGLGPVIGAPTASEDRFGSGKWTAGAAGAFVIPRDWGLVGGLATYQKSFAGADERPDTESLEVQPFVFYNFDDGFYLQSTASWAFNLERDTWSMPVGLGVGKLWHVNDDIKMNAFIEPQYTVASEGVGPKWRIFAGINFSYSLEKFMKH